MTDISIIEEDFRPVRRKTFSLFSFSLHEILLSGPEDLLPSRSVRYLSLILQASSLPYPIPVFGKVISRSNGPGPARLGIFPLRVAGEDLDLLKKNFIARDFKERKETVWTAQNDGGPFLVTGATGFVGSHLVLRLASQGVPLRIVIRNSQKAKQFEVFDNVEMLAGDLTDPVFVDHIVRDVSHVIHCAGFVSDWGTWKDFDQGNRLVTRQLARACLGQPIKRFVHISTTDIYGYPTDPGKCLEKTLQKPKLPYAASKYEAEQAVLECLRAGLPGIILRPATIYGPGSETIVKEFVNTLREGKMLWVGGGQSNAGLCYVENLVDAILLAAGSPVSVGQSYDITDDQPLCWRDFIVTLARILNLPPPRLSLPYSVLYAAGWLMEHLKSPSSPGRPWVTRTAVSLLGRDQGFPMARIKRELGYVPRVSFLETIVQTEAWIRHISVSG